MEFLRNHQLNFMLFLSGVCSVLTILVIFTKSLPKRRRASVGLVEFCAAMILIWDRYAYFYRGDLSPTGFYMTRISNFCVFFFSVLILFSFNFYLKDLLTKEGKLPSPPDILKVVDFLCIAGFFWLVLSQFCGLYYTFDEMNRYRRAPGFFIAYIFTTGSIALQMLVLAINYKRVPKFIRGPLILFTLLPTAATIVQIFFYGLSLTNMTITGVSILLYVVIIIDMTNTVKNAELRELELLKEEQETARLMFEQTAEALANSIDAKDKYTRGHSTRVAEYSKKIAQMAGKSQNECDEIYFAGLLHDVGKIGVPNSIINKAGKLTDEEFAQIKKHPSMGNQILSSITKSPYLSIGAHFHHERYDGKGYPEGLKGEDIPDIARIIAVADSYDAMTSKRSYRDPIPQQTVREEIVKGTGTQFDPKYAKIMLHLIDLDTEYHLKEYEEVKELAGKNKLSCKEFLSAFSEGILLCADVKKITLRCKANPDFASEKTIPSFIVFDSLDERIHQTERKQKDLLYFEYARVRFDGQTQTAGARKIQCDVEKSPLAQSADWPEIYKDGVTYEVELARFDDHAMIKISSKWQTAKIILALPDSSRYCYASLTGERCEIDDVEIKKTGLVADENYIPRIAPKVSYIDAPQGDIPNVQVDGYRSACSEGIPVTDGMKISFHTKSLPTARLIWHCPFITLFHSPDKKSDSPNSREFALIRLDGENWESGATSETKLLVSKNDSFEGWEAWKELNKKGMDCSVAFKRSGKQITVFTENSGIAIKCVTTIKGDYPTVYMALTGDQCAITGIKIERA